MRWTTEGVTGMATRRMIVKRSTRRRDARRKRGWANRKKADRLVPSSLTY